MTAKIGSLNVDVTLETARFKQGAAALSTETKKLEGRFSGLKTAGATLAGGLAGFGAGIVLGGLQSAATGAFELASALSEAASSVGVTVEALQELRVAANANGVSNEALQSSLGRLNVQLGDLQNGSKTAVAAFAALGLSAADLKGLKPDEALGLIADKIAAIKDPALQAAAAQDIFGKSYATMLPLLKQGKQAFDEAAEASRRQGQLSTEDAQKLDDLADTWDRLKTRVGVAVATLIARASDLFDEVDRVMTGINNFSLRTEKAIADFARNAVASFNSFVSGIVSAVTGRLSAAWDGLLDRIDRIKKAIKGLGSGLLPASFEGGGGGFQKASFFNIGAIANDNADETEIANVRIAKSFKDMADETLSALSGLSNAIKGGGFLDILSSVIGLGLQLGGAGLFGKTIQGRINAPSPPTGGMRGGAGKLQVEVIANNNGFGAMVRDQAGFVIAQATPSIVGSSVSAANSNAIARQARRLA